MDTLVLGCTHYPLLRPLLGARRAQEVFGHDIVLVDSADTMAASAHDELGPRLGLLRPSGCRRRPRCQCYVTDDARIDEEWASRFLWGGSWSDRDSRSIL